MHLFFVDSQILKSFGRWKPQNYYFLVLKWNHVTVDIYKVSTGDYFFLRNVHSLTKKKAWMSTQYVWVDRKIKKYFKKSPPPPPFNSSRRPMYVAKLYVWRSMISSFGPMIIAVRGPKKNDLCELKKTTVNVFHIHNLAKINPESTISISGTIIYFQFNK